MVDSSKDIMINKNRKSLLASFYLITEKPEESCSNSSKKDKEKNKPINTDNNSNNKFLINNDFSKKETKEHTNHFLNLPIKFFKKHSAKSFNKRIGAQKGIHNEEKNDKKVSKKGSQIKLNDLRTKLSEPNIHIFYSKPINKNENAFTRQNSDKNFIHSSKNISILYHNNINNNNLTNYSANNIFRLTNKALSKSRSLLSSSNESNIHFYANKGDNKNNRTILIRKKLISFHDNDDKMLQLNLFEKLKNSPMFEKSVKILQKERFYYALLIIFSFLSIIFQIIDALLYNKKSTEFLEKNRNNNNTTYLNNDHNYHILEKRTITNQENTIRIFNIIFSFICVLITVKSYVLKNKYIKQENKNTKYFYGSYKSHSQNKKKKSIKYEEHINIIPHDDLIPKKKIPKSEIVNTIIFCLINVICFPPSVNKVYITINKDFIFVYSLNSIVLLFTMLKFINIIRAIVHLSPLNNLIYKTMCNSKMVKMNFLFMLRYFLNRYPMIFIVINFFIFGTIFCILIYAIEFFSLDLKNGYWNNKGDNNLKNLYNTIYLYLFFIIKNEFGDIMPKSEIGLFIMLIIGTLGSFGISYFVYFMLQIIQLSSDEEKAYSKISKIMDPLNKQHKSANLIKYLILIRQIFKENKNFEKSYAINKLNYRKMNYYKKSYKKLVFNPEDIYKNYALIEENVRNKRQFIYYLYHKFIIKTKIFSECKIFNNNLKIARNFSHSFTDLLKTLGHKINDNLNQLDSKLQVIIYKERQYVDFMKFQKKNVKRIKKISFYQNEIIDYLINKHNTIDHEENLAFKGTKRTKTGFHLYSKNSNKNLNRRMKEISYITSPRKYGYNKIKSSELSSGILSNLGIMYLSKIPDNNDNHKHKHNIIDKKKIKRVSSLNNNSLHCMNKIKKAIKYEKINMKSNIKRQLSYNKSKNKIIDKNSQNKISY